MKSKGGRRMVATFLRERVVLVESLKMKQSKNSKHENPTDIGGGCATLRCMGRDNMTSFYHMAQRAVP